MTPLDILLTGWLAAALALLIAASATCYRREQQHDAERKDWTEERRELLNRIQRPGHIPVAAQTDFQVPEREPDEWAQVGQIVIDDKYGLEDD